MSEHAENWANLQNRSLARSGLEIQFGLLGRPLAQQRALSPRRVPERVRPQQPDGVSQQRHAPREPQTVEKQLPQSQLVFLLRPGGLDPRTDLLQQSPGRQRVERQPSQQRFVRRRRVSELARAVAGLPADRTEFGGGHGAKPMPIFGHLIAKPVQ